MKRCVNLLPLATILFSFAHAWADDPSHTFPKGTLSLQTYGTYSAGRGQFSNLESATVGAGYFIFDNVSLSLEASGFCVQNLPGADGEMYRVSGMLRHHLIDLHRMTLFIDVAFGPIEATERVPDGGTYFNFETRTGVGATIQLRDHIFLLAGARYFHISNARIEGAMRNPSINGIEGYAGVMWTF